MAESPVPTKRARTSPRQEGTYQLAKKKDPIDVSLQPFRHLKHVRFPPAILALPHVLKQIDTFLLSPKEAIVEAAATGQFDWLNELLDDLMYLDCVALDAVEAAAANGHLDAVQVLYDVDYRHEEEDLSPDKFGALKKAVLAAVKKGYAHIVEYLLPLLVTDPNLHARNGENRSLVLEVVAEAAANGHLEVLKIVMGLERIKHHLKMYHESALSRAIAAQHTHVVDFLLEKHEYNWNLKGAFEEAVAQGQTEIAEQIYNVFPQFSKGKNLFVELAFYGRLNAVEYLYNNGRRDPDLVCKAFVRAAEMGSVNLATFLHDTGLISLDAFGEAWKVAAMCWGSNSDIMLYLYGLKRASPLALNQWFERVSHIDVLKLLYENEVIPDSSIVAAFHRAARCLSKEDVEIVKFLYENKCITSDAIDRVFVNAVSQHRTDLVKLLQNDSRLTPKGIDEGFVQAVENGREVEVKALYDQHQITPSGLLKAFTRTVRNEYYFGLTKIIVKYLSADTVPRDYKLEAFMHAAKRGQIAALEIIIDSEGGEWPIDELKDALSVARNSKVEHFIRKAICDQLFSGRPQQVRLSGDDGHVITALKWHIGD